MPNGTWDEASKCPKCGLSGEVSKTPRQLPAEAGASSGARLVEIFCRNNRCSWFNTPWEVQINKDGTIPDPNTPRGEKRFKPLDQALAATMRDRFQTLQEMTTQGGEVRR